MPSSLFSLCRGLCSLFFGASNSKPLRSLSGSPSYFPTTLPPETWAAVAAHLFEAEDIVSLACTSSSLCVIAERKLYRRVWLWDPLSLSRFVHALRHRPERALYVHTFRFAVDPAAGTPIDVQDTAEANLAYVLRTCSRLRGLELPEWTLRVPVDVVTEVGLSLKSLEILSEESTDSWLAPLLRSQPRLLRLRVWGALALPATDDAQQLCASLSTIAMNAQSLPLMVTGRPVERVEVLGVCNVQEVIAAILRSTKTVKSLTLRPDTPPEDFLPVLRDNLPDLEELIVTGVRSTYFDQLASEAVKFPRWPRLRALGLCWDYGTAEATPTSGVISRVVDVLGIELPLLVEINLRGLPYYTWEVPGLPSETQGSIII